MSPVEYPRNFGAKWQARGDVSRYDENCDKLRNWGLVPTKHELFRSQVRTVRRP